MIKNEINRSNFADARRTLNTKFCINLSSSIHNDILKHNIYTNKYMIRKVSFENFYSFNKKQEIDFTAHKKEGYDYYSSKKGDQITKVAGFIGANASGKTNIMRLFSFLSHLLKTNSVNTAEEEPRLAYKSFFNNKKPTNIGIEFEINSTIYYYSVSLLSDKILNEKLEAKQIKNSAKKCSIFSRDEKKNIVLNKKIFKGLDTNVLSKIRPEISLIPYIKSHYDIETINQVFVFFDKFKTNINEMGMLNSPAYQVKILNNYLKEESVKKKMEKVVSNFDLGLLGFNIDKKEENLVTKITVDGIHRVKKEDKTLDFIYESRGTQSLFFVLGYILSAIKDNSVIILDEIETGLHPEALNKIISYFIDENSNETAQLIFSSHSFEFLNRFDIHQTYLVEKNDDSESICYRLNDVDGIRSDENFKAKYMSGSYGAFPYISA